MKFAVTAYVPAFVCVAPPPVKIEEALPGTEPLTVAAWAAPSYVTGVLETESVGVAFAMTKLPAAAVVSEL